MKSSAIRHLRSALMLIGIIGLLPATVFAASWAEAVKGEILNRAGVQYVTGWVDCGAEVEDAEIRIYDTDGKLLNLAPRVQHAPVLSGASGIFAVAVANLPDRFRIKAVNGRCAGKPFGELEAELLNVDPEQDLVHINLVTTLLASFLDRYPGIDFEEAQGAVKHYLELPDRVDLSKGPDIAAADFNLPLLRSEAVVAGGVQPLMERLVGEMADPSATFQFRASQGFPGMLTDWVVDNIAGEIWGATGSKAFGYFLSAIGFPSGEPDLLNEIKKVQQSLDDIKNMMTDLDSSLNRVGDEIKAELAQVDYNGQVASTLEATQIISQIKRYSAELAALSALRVAGKETSIANFEQRQSLLLTNIDRNILGSDGFRAIDLISAAQLSQGGRNGLIQVWSQAVSRRHRFLQTGDSELMRSQFDYFDALQLAALALSLEYYYATKPPDTVNAWVDPLIKEYQAKREAQLQILPLRIPEEALIETHSGYMIAHTLIWRVVSQPYNTTSLARASRAVTDLNNHHYLGFNNWRLPSSGDIGTVFFGRPSKDIGTWARGLGYPPEYMNDGVVMFIEDGYLHPGRFHFSNGKFDQNITCEDLIFPSVDSWRCYHDYAPKQGPFGNVIPVRRPSSNERYYYQ